MGAELLNARGRKDGWTWRS